MLRAIQGIRKIVLSIYKYMLLLKNKKQQKKLTFQKKGLALKGLKDFIAS